MWTCYLVGQNPVNLGRGVLLVKYVDNVDYMGSLQHVGVIGKRSEKVEVKMRGV